MKTLYRAIFLCLSTFSFTAQAAFIDIEYSGLIYHSTVDSEHFGYAIGSRITGAMHIDLSLADPAESSVTPESAFYSFYGPGIGMINDLTIPASLVERTGGYIFTYDNADPPTNHDYAVFSAGTSMVDGSYKSIAVSVKLGALNWVNSTSLDGINVLINDAELLKDSMGIGYASEPISGFDMYSSAMQMRFDYLKIVSTPTPVPEPGPVSLALLGLIALYITRNRFNLSQQFWYKK